MSTPTLISAASRLTHGSAGTFDVPLPLGGGAGVECRSIAGGLRVVLTFDQAVTGGSAAVTAGSAAVVGTPAISGATMTVALAGLADAGAVTVRAANVTNAAGETLVTADVPLRTLFGDVDGDGQRTGSDVDVVHAAVAAGLSVDGTTFRCDLNLDGAFTSSDLNLVRSAVAGLAATAPAGLTATLPGTVVLVVASGTLTAAPSDYTSSNGTVTAVTLANASSGAVGVLPATAGPLTITWAGATSSAVAVAALPAVPAGCYLAVGAADALAATVSPSLVSAYLATASPVGRQAALAQASSDVDLSMRFQGRRYDTTGVQVAEFPRVARSASASIYAYGGAYPSLGDVVWDLDPVSGDPVVPARVLTAVLFQADSVLRPGSDRLADAQYHGLAGETNGPVSETYGGGRAPGVVTGLCRRAYQLMAFYRLASGRLT